MWDVKRPSAAPFGEGGGEGAGSPFVWVSTIGTSRKRRALQRWGALWLPLGGMPRDVTRHWVPLPSALNTQQQQTTYNICYSYSLIAIVATAGMVWQWV